MMKSQGIWEGKMKKRYLGNGEYRGNGGTEIAEEMEIAEETDKTGLR